MKLAVPPASIASERWQVLALTAVAMLAFAGNSLLCRLALRSASIDPAGFTAVRLGSAALALWLLAPAAAPSRQGSWASAIALFAYAAGFSFAYVELPAGVGALVLFGAVQLTMIGWALRQGERLNALQLAGAAAAIAGLAMLLLPGSSGPVPASSVSMMLAAGVAWGVYSLRGRGVTSPTAVTRANFILSIPFATALLLAFMPPHMDALGFALAVASGAITSGAGYVVWYIVLPKLRATHAATVQLCVPAIAAAMGFAFLGERLTWEQWLSAGIVLAGVALTVRR